MSFDHDRHHDPSRMDIVVAEDDRVSRRMLVRILSRWGYTVHEATGGDKAWELLRQSEAPLLVTDWTMPGMTGEKLAHEIMNIRPDMPVILCTGYSELITEESARQIGIREFVMKPLVTHQLANIIRRVLDA